MRFGVKKNIVLTLAMLAFSLPCCGLAAEETQKAQLLSLIDSFNAAVQKHDIDFLIARLPQHLMQQMSLRLHKEPAQLQAQLRLQMTKQLESDKGVAFSLKKEKIQFCFLNTQKAYALIPSELRSEKKAKNMLTVALYEEGAWHFIWGGEQVLKNPIFIDIYPRFHKTLSAAPAKAAAQD